MSRFKVLGQRPYASPSILFFSLDHFNQSGPSSGKITPAVLLPLMAK